MASKKAPTHVLTDEDRAKSLESRHLSILTQKAAMIKGMVDHFCVVKYACAQAGITRETHYNWLENDDEYREQINQLKENNLDVAEYALMKMINGMKDPALIKWYLETHGTSRGYGKKISDTIGGEGQVVAEIPRLVWVKTSE